MMGRAYNYSHGNALKERGQSEKMVNSVISEAFGISLNEKLIKLHENEDKKIFYVTKLQKDNPDGD